MSNQEILEKAIQKAIDGGWDMPGRDMAHPQVVKDLSQEGVDRCYIFHHDFAKALWGESLVMGFKGNNLGQTYQFHEPAWQYHLQNMVIAEDPIKYLGENL